MNEVSEIVEQTAPQATDWTDDGYVSDSRAVFVGGVARSGTTLLSVMLDAHPGLVCGPETDLLRRWPTIGRMTTALGKWSWHVLRGWTDDYSDLARNFQMSLRQMRRLRLTSRCGAEFIDRFFAGFARRHGVDRWVDKTPANVVCLDFLFKHFPQAKFVHVIRDGRDTVCSMRQWPSRLGNRQRQSIEQHAEYWDRWVRLGRKWTAHPNYLELRYEQLVESPEPVLRNLLETLELDWSDRVLSHWKHLGDHRPDTRYPHVAGVNEPPYTRSIGRWRCDLSRDDRLAFQRTAGPLLCELGYCDSSAWIDE